MSISEGTLIAIREIPITAVLEAESIPYKKIGHEAVTVCPWHNDTNPSLTLNDDKSMCFCFVCRGGSDSIDYIQQKFSHQLLDNIILIRFRTETCSLGRFFADALHRAVISGDCLLGAHYLSQIGVKWKAGGGSPSLAKSARICL